MNTLIQLIGAQPLPNLLPPLHLKPDQTSLVYNCTLLLCLADDARHRTVGAGSLAAR
jgi:hypothetical protein